MMNLKTKQKIFLQNLIILIGTITIIFSNKKFIDSNEYLVSEYEKNQYGETDKYLEISKNFSKMGPMISGKEGQYEIYPINWNDPIFPILVSILAFFGIEFHTFSDLVFINYILFWFSLLCFSFLFLKEKPLVFGIAQLMIIHYIYQTGFKNSVDFVDQHGTIPALSVLTFSLTEILFKNTNNPIRKLFILSFCGGFFGMFRNYFSYVFILLIGLFSKNALQSKKQLPLLLYSLVAMLIAINFSGLLQRTFYHYAQQKNPHLSFNSSHSPYEHGIWWAAYLGLGVFKNKWEIQWDDGTAIEHAQRYDPTVVGCDSKCFLVMRKLYFKYLKEEPLEYIKNHMKKIYIVIIKILKKNYYLIIISFLVFFVMFFSGFNEIIRRDKFLLSAHAIPLFIFFIVPIITSPLRTSYSFAIINYMFLIIITINVKLLGIIFQKIFYKSLGKEGK